jgi:hypothetical protein
MQINPMHAGQELPSIVIQVIQPPNPEQIKMLRWRYIVFMIFSYLIFTGAWTAFFLISDAKWYIGFFSGTLAYLVLFFCIVLGCGYKPRDLYTMTSNP